MCRRSQRCQDQTVYAVTDVHQLLGASQSQQAVKSLSQQILLANAALIGRCCCQKFLHQVVGNHRVCHRISLHVSAQVNNQKGQSSRSLSEYQSLPVETNQGSDIV